MNLDKMRTDLAIKQKKRKNLIKLLQIFNNKRNDLLVYSILKDEYFNDIKNMEKIKES